MAAKDDRARVRRDVRPNSTFISVLLPEPFSPRRPRISPGLEIKIDAVDRAHRAKAARDPAHFEKLAHEVLTIPTRQRLVLARRRGVQLSETKRSSAAARVLLRRRDLQRPVLNCAAMSSSSFTTAAGTTGLNALPASYSSEAPVTGAVS